MLLLGATRAPQSPELKVQLEIIFVSKSPTRESSIARTAKELEKSETFFPSPIILLPRLVKQTKKGHVHVQLDEQRAQLVNVNFSHLTKWKFSRQGAAPSASNPPPWAGLRLATVLCSLTLSASWGLM